MEFVLEIQTFVGFTEMSIQAQRTQNYMQSGYLHGKDH